MENFPAEEINSIDGALARNIESDQAPDKHDLQLANELLRTHLTDEERQAHTLPQVAPIVPEDFTPLSKDEFKSIISAAQLIKDRNELNDLKAKQKQHSRTGNQVTDALVEANDTVSPVAQARILEVYEISLDIFRQAKDESRLGESQNNFRKTLAQNIGLSANATRGRIQIEQEIARRCEDAREKIDDALAALRAASLEEKFRHDLVNKNGILTEEYDGHSFRSEYEKEFGRRIKLFLEVKHLRYGVNYPGLTSLEYAQNIFSDLFRARDTESYAQKKMAGFDFTFTDVCDRLKQRSPAFHSFIEQLPESIEVVGEMDTWGDGTKHCSGRKAFSKGVSALWLTFKLKGYAEK